VADRQERTKGPDRVNHEQESDSDPTFAGAITGAYEEGELERLRNEWR